MRIWYIHAESPTTRLSTAITLFMALASVSTTYGATYTDTQIGAGIHQHRCL